MKSMTAVATLLSAVLMVPVSAFAQEHDAEHLVIDMANTPEEHRAVSRHYMLNADEVTAVPESWRA